MCACTCVRVGVGACMHVLKELRVHTCARVDGSARAHVIGVCPFSLSQQEAAVCAIRLKHVPEQTEGGSPLLCQPIPNGRQEVH